ncbi:MAG TPA: ABC transporter ATP-binding protein [Candidatus Saccharimonadales bacterium]|nr:ABC transporter ATP-binding protein [Candidatus Saccharimonadales bacterium]
MTQRQHILRAQELHKSFGQTAALRGASLTVQKGEVLAIMGPSGSGKSTLLHCLAGILVPDKGEVWLEGTKLNDLNEEARTKLRREQFGFVFQFGQLVPELTALENVALSLLLAGKKRSEAFATSEPWFERLNIAGLEERRAGEISGGQAQRVALARALALQPKVLFADEPTGALDTLAGEKVMELLTEAARKEDVTVVLVTHDPRVAAYADREVIVRDGVVTANAEGSA